MLDLNKIYCGDCLEIMKDIPDKSIDLVLTDPPYGTTQNKWDIIVDFKLLWKELLRIGKSDATFIFTSAQPFTTDLINSNRKMFKYDLVFEKTLGSGFLNAKKMPLRTHEDILIFYSKLSIYNPIMGKGVNKKGFDTRKDNGDNYGKFTKENRFYDDRGTRYPKSIIKISTGNRTVNRFHPTQKPEDLMKYLIKTYSNENDTILDPFLGSGTTAVACQELHRNYIGIEISKEYCKIAEERLKQQPLF